MRTETRRGYRGAACSRAFQKALSSPDNPGHPAGSPQKNKKSPAEPGLKITNETSASVSFSDERGPHQA